MTDDEPAATLPAVVSYEGPRADWSEWSANHERRRLEAEIEARRQANKPIYPRELAQAIAGDAARTMIPDWRIVRDEHRRLFVDLLKQQPELQQREVKHLDNLLRMVTDQLPAAMRPLMTDLRTILEIRILAHETAAFFVGVETGRRLETHHDRVGQIRAREARGKLRR